MSTTSKSTNLEAESTPDIYILGFGAIASLWACFLCSRGNRVTVIQRDSSNDGVCLANINYEDAYNDQPSSRQYSVSLVSAHTLTTRHAKISRLIIATKSQDIVPALNSVRHLLCRDAEIMTLCNGLGFQQKVRDLLTDEPEINVFNAITSDGALLHNGSTLCHTGLGQTYIGCWEKVTGKSHVHSQLLDILLDERRRDDAANHSDSQALPRLKVSFCDNIAARSIEKFFVNCAINPLTAIEQCRNGSLLTNNELNTTFKKVCAELQRVYDGLRSSWATLNLPQTNIYDTASDIVRKTSLNQSSMLQDRLRGKQLELEYLNGYLLKLTDQLGLEAPLSSALLDRLTIMSSHRHGQRQ